MANTRASIEQNIARLNKELTDLENSIDAAIARARDLESKLNADSAIKNRFPKGLQHEIQQLTLAKNSLIIKAPAPTNDDFKDQTSIDSFATQLQQSATVIDIAVKDAKDTLDKVSKALDGIHQACIAAHDQAKAAALKPPSAATPSVAPAPSIAIDPNLSAREKKTRELLDRIKKAGADAKAKFNNDYPDVTKHNSVNSALHTEVESVNVKNVALFAIGDTMADPMGNLLNPPLTTAELNVIEGKITNAITELNTAIANVKKPYDAAVAAAAAASATLDANKKALRKEIRDFYNKPETQEILDAVKKAIKANPALKSKYAAISAANTDLSAIVAETRLAATDQARLERLEADFDNNVKDAFSQAINAAKTDVYQFRAEHVKATFNRYVEQISLIQATVDAAVGKGDATLFKDALAKVERMKMDLELHKDWMIREKNEDAAKLADAQIARLDKIISTLTTNKNLGAVHFSNRSIKVDDKDTAGAPKGEKQFEDNITQTKKDILKNTVYTAAGPSAATGSLSSVSPAISKMAESRTAGFSGLKQFEGRVQFAETGDENHKTAALLVQRIRDGARVSEVEFLTDSTTNKPVYDNSTQRQSAQGGPAFGYFKFASDSVNEIAIIHVLEHIYAASSEDLRKKMVDASLKNILEGKDDPILRQAAKGEVIHITGGLQDTYAQATKDICHLIGVECHDTRNANLPHVHLIKDKEMTEKRGEAYRILLHDKKDIILAKTFGAVAKREYAAELDKLTKPVFKP